MGAAAWGMGVNLAAAAEAPAGGGPDKPAGRAAPGGVPYNMLFILTDRERFFRPGELPAGYSLPAHERLMSSCSTSNPILSKWTTWRRIGHDMATSSPR